VATELGKGTTFRVRLPAADPNVSDSLAGPGKGGGKARPAYARRRVLAVDDEALLLKAYRRMLSDVHEVVTALGARDALLVLEKTPDFDVVLCDLQMPEMSGMEFYQLAKSRYPGLEQRFIFVTGGACSTDARRFLEQSVTCVNKPFRVDELLGAIEQKVAPGAGDSRPAAVGAGGRGDATGAN